MIDPNDLADNLERDVGGNAFIVIDRAELLVVLAALRLYGAAQQPVPDVRPAPRPTIFRADGSLEFLDKDTPAINRDVSAYWGPNPRPTSVTTTFPDGRVVSSGVA